MDQAPLSQRPLSVSSLVLKMKRLLEGEIGEVLIEGEISNFRRQASGHCYFSMKDEGAQIACVLFAGNARRVQFDLVDGLAVKLFGEVSVYAQRGQMQMIARGVELAGKGDLHAQFEALKKKLAAKGYFDQSCKQALPPSVSRVGLVTSGSGAALQDMLDVMGRRAPWVIPVLYPVAVQGKGAHREIAKAIRELSHPLQYALPQCDVIIVGRGGGALEDLWNFNEEDVALAIVDSPIPIVSAVGHETDFTIADFVADVRAPTPSAAAECVVIDAKEAQKHLLLLEQRLERSIRGRIEQHEEKIILARRLFSPANVQRFLREKMQNFDFIVHRLVRSRQQNVEQFSQKLQAVMLRHTLLKPQGILENFTRELKKLESQMEKTCAQNMENKQERLKRMGRMVENLSPQAIFARGFSMTTNSQGSILTSSKDLKEGMRIRTYLGDGHISSRIENLDK